MQPTTITLDTHFQIAPVDERIFGGFLEHMGRAVYEGVYEPGSPQADEDGFRRDVLAALGRLKMTAMRYPGGNFASGYHWRDGVGPKQNRPTVLELAWQSIETNQFGTEEYIRLCRKMGWTPMLTVNLGTGTPEEARDWVEYCNCPTGSRWADLRAANGSPAPHSVKLWCLGNEMDGPWQLGHVPAEHYAIRAQQAAKMMKDCDRSIQTVLCGSCGTGMSTYMEWDRQVLEHCWDLVDFISLHRYVGNREGDSADFLAVGTSIDRQIEEMDAACRFVQARRRSKKRVYLCFDEWNVWYKNMQMDGQGKRAPHLIEEVYNLEDALVVAQFLMSFIRHADCVKIANIAQIVNIIAPILTDGPRMMIQTIFHPFEMISRVALPAAGGQCSGGVSLRPAIEGPCYEGKTNGPAGYIDAAAILHDLAGRKNTVCEQTVPPGNASGAPGRLSVFLVNRSLTEPAPVTLALDDRPILAVESAEILTGPDAKAANSFDNQNVIAPAPFTRIRITAGRAELTLPPLSFAAVTVVS